MFFFPQQLKHSTRKNVLANREWKSEGRLGFPRDSSRRELVVDDCPGDNDEAGEA